MLKFRPGQTGSVVHSSLKTAVKTMDQARNNALQWFTEVHERKLYLDLGYSTINQYAMKELGFSKTRCGDFLNLCNKLKKLPQIETDLKSGKLGYTSARELIKVSTPKNEGQWLETAKNCNRDELANQVKKARQRAADEAAQQPSLLPETEIAPLPKASPPVRISLEMSPVEFARYETLWEKARKMGGLPAGKTEALLEMLECYVAKKAPRGPLPKTQPTQNNEDGNIGPESSECYIASNDIGVSSRATHQESSPPAQIHIHLCPDCQETTVQTSKGELTLTQTERDRANCDCEVNEPGKPNRKSIPPATRRAVLTRDRHVCQAPGCPHTRFLEVHHIVPRSHGGNNDSANLIAVCSTCHKLIHEGKLQVGGLMVKSPAARYTTGRGLVGLDPGYWLGSDTYPSAHSPAQNLVTMTPANFCTAARYSAKGTFTRPPVS